MCIPYNGVDYHHGLSVNKKTEEGSRCFDVLVTKHLEDQPYRYSGICLNNGYEVFTYEYAKPTALIDLLEKIVDDTLASEKEYAVRFSGKTYKPLINIKEKEPNIYNDFSKKMKNACLLDNYNVMHNELKPFLENPQFDNNYYKDNDVLIELLKDLNNNFLQKLINIYDCKDMYLTSNFVKRNNTLKDCEIKYSRV